MLQRPNWSFWVNLVDVRLREAAALSCDVSPESTEGDLPLGTWPAVSEMVRRVDIARSHVQAGTLMVERRLDLQGNEQQYVKLGDFRLWGQRLPVPFTFPESYPAELPKTPCSSTPLAPSWPWGLHETELLRQLARAGERFWKNYDSNDPSTASTNETVAAWLGRNGVSKRVAEVMAQILRADGLRPGPR